MKRFFNANYTNVVLLIEMLNDCHTFLMRMRGDRVTNGANCANKIF
jgi:hypothetical protein